MEVGFLGLGIMGKAMAMNLLRSGFKVTVWNRTLSKCDELKEHGASVGETAAAVIKKCKYTIAMLSDPSAALSVVFDKDGVLEQIGSGKAYIDMSTVDAETSTKISEAVTHPSIKTSLAALSVLHELLPTPLRYLATIVKRIVVKMASSTKYQPAPQSDPDDYTHAPPAYAEGSSSRDETQGLFGAPRNSEDNLPDDFKFGGSVAEATVDIRNQFVRKVYTILTVQLLATAGVSSLTFFSAGYKEWIQGHPGVVWASLFGAMIFMGLTYWKRKSYPTNLLFLSLFTLAEAYTISVIVSFYKTSIVLNAVVLTAGIFVFLTLFACQTKYDFTSWMPYLFGALWGLVIFGFMAMFFPYSSTGELIYGGLAALIFSGYILVDTQLVLRHHHVEEEIAAAISLYLDIINLFLAILRILNSQSNN